MGKIGRNYSRIKEIMEPNFSRMEEIIELNFSRMEEKVDNIHVRRKKCG